MSVTESTYQIKAGIAAAVTSVLTADSTGGEVGLIWGEPGPTSPREFVCIMGAQVDTDAATMGTNRTRDENIRQQINIVVNGQGKTAQQATAVRAYALMAAIEKKIRTDLIDVTGCLWCFLTRIDESGGTDAADRAAGRYTEIIAEFTARVRITN